jgi:dolichol-phosphate mannosyltransferase
MPEIEDLYAPYDLTVVIPTYREPGIGTLLRDIDQTCARANLTAEVIVVDDTPDQEVVNAVQDTMTVCEVQVIHRPSLDEVWGGLSGAVVDGMREAQAPIVVVMDGDGQHPASAILPMWELLEPKEWVERDMVVASRYVDGGDSGGLDGGWRRWVSTVCTFLARVMFPKRVWAKTTDPMTGFFAVRTDTVDLDKVKAYTSGFKILLTILATHPYLEVGEVPFVFGKRNDGESKAGLKNGTTFLRQLVRLRVDS